MINGKKYINMVNPFINSYWLKRFIKLASSDSTMKLRTNTTAITVERGGPLPSSGIGISSINTNTDTLRGLACLLVVIYHVVGGTSGSGLHVPENSLWRWLTMSLDYVRMPLITGLAGYIFSITIEKTSDIPAFVKRKAFVLLLPAIFTGLVYWVIRGELYGPEDELLTALVNGYLHLWYLYAIFIIFVAAAVMRSVLVTPVGLAVLFAASILLTPNLPPLPQVLSISGAFYLLPFFLAGIACNAWYARLTDSRVQAWLGGFAGCVMLTQQYAFFTAQPPMAASAALPTLCGCAMIVLLLAKVEESKFLDFLSRFSFAIFLWHSAANASFRYVFVPMTDNTGLLLLMGIFAGIAVPTALQILVERLAPAALPLLGGRRRTAR